MRTLVVDHPLVAHKLTVLRDKETDSPTFRSLADELRKQGHLGDRSRADRLAADPARLVVE